MYLQTLSRGNNTGADIHLPRPEGPCGGSGGGGDVSCTERLLITASIILGMSAWVSRFWSSWFVSNSDSLVSGC